MRGIGDEILAHGLQLALPGRIPDQQEHLAGPVGHRLELEAGRIAHLGMDRQPGPELPRAEVAEEVRVADEVVDADPEVGLPPQSQQLGGPPVEPEDLVAGIQRDHAVRHRSGRAPQFAEHADDALFVELLAAVQTADLGDDVAP